MDDNIVKIGDYEIHAPVEHKLPDYLAVHPQYDFKYWRTIEKIAKSISSKDFALIDIGANIGDTVAHFRSFSMGDVLAIEAAAIYFPYLVKNTAQFNSVTTIFAAMSTPLVKDQIALYYENGTGRTEVDGTSKFEGNIVYAGGLISRIPDDFILKSDTDGFDGNIISSFVKTMSNQNKFAKIVTFEGPSEEQGRSDKGDEHLKAIKSLQELGYEILFLNNLGQPLNYCGCNYEAVEFFFKSWVLRLKYGNIDCRYFDIIAVRGESFSSIVKHVFNESI